MEYRDIYNRSDIYDLVALEALNGDSDRHVHVFGRNESVSTTYEDIWSVGGIKTWMQAANNLTIVSDSADDDITGSAARTLFIDGLDADFNRITETVELQGLAPVQTVKQYIRINEAYVQGTGTYGSTNDANTGTITISDNTNPQAQIEPNVGRTQQSHYTIPAGYTGLIYGFDILTNSNSKTVDMKFLQRQNADVVSGTMTASRVFVAVSDFNDPILDYHPRCPYIFPEKTDIWAAIKFSTGTSAASINYEVRLMSDT